MTTTKPQSTTEPRLLPCPLLGHLPDKSEFTAGPYIAVSGAPDMPKFYAVVCPGCCSTAYDEDKERVIKKWNSRTHASVAPVVDNVGLNLLRQLVGGKNSLRTLGVFPCNQAEHEDVDCKCFWEQCEAWARQDAGIAPVDQLVCAKCGKPRKGVSAESFLCRYCFSTESTAVASSGSLVEQTVYVSEHPVTLHCNTCGMVQVKSLKCPRGDGQLVVGATPVEQSESQ